MANPSRQVPIPAYVSSRSANALISELSPTVLAPDALLHLNLVLDELLGSLVAAAQSIAPDDIKTKAIGKVFANVSLTSSANSPVLPSSPKPRTLRTQRHPSQTHFRAVSTSLQVTKDAAALALGREAVNEAELEVKAWRDGRRAEGREDDGFVTDPRGLRGDAVRSGGFPVVQAVDLLRCRIMAYSTLGNDKSDVETVRWLTEEWERAGGSTRNDVLDPAALYFTAIIEHVSERILADIGKLIARSTSSTSASLYDLYSALCEDEATWGFFKRMAVKTAIENQLSITPTSSAYNLGRTATRDSFGSSVHLSGAEQEGIITTPSGGIRGPSLDITTPTSARRVSLSRRGPSFDSPRPSQPPTTLQKRASFALLQNVPGAGVAGRRVSMDEGRGAVVPEDEFDALVASGETLKVSLTPSRLKVFDATRLAGNSGTAVTMTPTPGGSNPPLQTSRSSISSVGALAPMKLLPRDETIVGKRSAELERTNGESLQDVLQSEPPWGRQAQVKARQPALSLPVLGEPVQSTPIAPLSPQIETLSPKKGRSETAALQDFLMNTPPPAQEELRRGSVLSVGQNESPSRLKTLVNRVAGGKQVERRSSQMDKMLSIPGRRSSAGVNSTQSPTSPTLDRRGSPALAPGLFSSRDQHIQDEIIGPSTVNGGAQRRMLNPLVEVGSILSGEGNSLRGMNISSPTSVNASFYTPMDTNGTAATDRMSGKSGIESEPTRELPTGNERVPVTAIPIADILQLRQDMKDVGNAEECWTLVDQLLRRYGVSGA